MYIWPHAPSLFDSFSLRLWIRERHLKVIMTFNNLLGPFVLSNSKWKKGEYLPISSSQPDNFYEQAYIHDLPIIKSLTANCAFMYTDTNGRFMNQTFGFQWNFNLLCFRQTRLMRTGPREKFGDLVPRHNNRQTALFPHFLQLQTRHDMVLSSSLKQWPSLGYSARCWDEVCASEVYLVIRSCLARWWRDGDGRMLALLEHGRMPIPEEGAELVPVVAAWEHATQGKDHNEQESSPQGKPQGWPWGMLNRQCHGWRRCQIFQPGHLHHLASFCLVESPDFQGEDTGYIYLEGTLWSCTCTYREW